MKIKASVELTTEELLTIISASFEKRFNAGRPYGELPAGQAFALLSTGPQKLEVLWGEQLEEPISPPPPVATVEKSGAGVVDDVPF